MAHEKLTIQQMQFVDEYLVDLNATAAYRRAGYKAKGNSAEVCACRLLSTAKVAAEIQKRMDARSARVEITADRVLKEIAKLAFYDPRKFFHADGTPIPVTELDDDTAAALAGIDVLEEFEGSGKDRVFVGYTKKFKLTDKRASLELLGRHLKLFTDKTEVTGKDGEAQKHEVVNLNLTAEEAYRRMVEGKA